jgi:hypothetical protein
MLTQQCPVTSDAFQRRLKDRRQNKDIIGHKST